jgi:hypothetical protein
VRLEEGEEDLQILPVGAVVAVKKHRSVEAVGVGLAEVVANVLEVLNNIPANP